MTVILLHTPLIETIETTHIHRVVGITGERAVLFTARRLRTPHHTISGAGLIGRGHVAMSGEVSLA